MGIGDFRVVKLMKFNPFSAVDSGIGVENVDVIAAEQFETLTSKHSDTDCLAFLPNLAERFVCNANLLFLVYINISLTFFLLLLQQLSCFLSSRSSFSS